MLLWYYVTQLMQWCRQGVGRGGAEDPPEFKLMLLCVKAVTTKGHPKFIIIEKQERKNQLSGYKQCYIYKKQNLEMSKYMNLALVTCNKLNPRG